METCSIMIFLCSLFSFEMANNTKIMRMFYFCLSKSRRNFRDHRVNHSCFSCLLKIVVNAGFRTYNSIDSCIDHRLRRRMPHMVCPISGNRIRSLRRTIRINTIDAGMLELIFHETTVGFVKMIYVINIYKVRGNVQTMCHNECINLGVNA